MSLAAAGNETTDAYKSFPAAYDEVIAVSAMADTDGLPGGLGGPYVNCTSPPAQDDTFAPFSNFGAVIDISAPGVCVQSTYPGGFRAFADGTSFSTPLVAGGAALYRATHPLASPADVKAALLANAEPGPITGDPDAFPEGVLNVAGF
ncbi:MAG: S8 family serine peptidase [Acidimicrobiia bacterium]|nr:S8 family serine peptidase [Acidimicrobiia bacterium]